MIAQGSPAWHARRLQGIGGSEIAAVMGQSIYQTPYGLWRIKRGLDQEQSSNWAMCMGQREEPRARAEYERQVGEKAPASFHVHRTRPHMFASLDGHRKAQNRPVEIKWVGRDDHELSKNFRVPEKHKLQIQHQMAVIEAARADYFSWDGKVGYLVCVEVDERVQRMILTKVDEFWARVVNNDPPALIDLDYKLMRSSPDAEKRKQFHLWKSSQILAERAEVHLERLYRFSSGSSFHEEKKPKCRRHSIKINNKGVA